MTYKLNAVESAEKKSKDLTYKLNAVESAEKKT